MNRRQLEHVIRAAATIPGDTEKYVGAVVRHRLVERETLRERLSRTPIDDAIRSRVAALIEADFSR